MKYLKQQITDLTFSSITEEYPMWDKDTTYIYEEDSALTSASVAIHKNYIYRSVTNPNLNSEPTDENPKWYWLNSSKTASVSNKYALLDTNSKTRTVSNEQDLVVEFQRESISTLAIGNFEASGVIIEHLDETDTVIPTVTQTFTYGVNATVTDVWTYMYEPYSNEVNRNLAKEIPPIGQKIRVTVQKTLPGVTNRARIGFLYGGQAVNMGKTLTGVSTSFDTYIEEIDDAPVRSAVTQTVSYQTIFPRESLVYIENRITDLKREDGVYVFIVDDTPQTLYENKVVLAKLQSGTTMIDSASMHKANFTIYENP